MVTADRRYYPFTEINPYLPWYQQLKIKLFGESVSESLERFKVRQVADRIYDSLQVSKGKFRNVSGLTPVTTPIFTPTPNNWIGNLGINTPTIGSGLNTPTKSLNFFDYINDTNTQNRLNSLTPTPTTIPTLSDENLKNIGGGASDWLQSKNVTPKASTSKLPIKSQIGGIDTHENKFNVLSND